MIEKWIKKQYEGFNVYERNVFGCFFNIRSLGKTGDSQKVIQYISAVKAYLICKWQRYRKKDIYIRYVEIPITTRCTLNCKECNNLIQVYQEPVNYYTSRILRDIKRICSVSEKIEMLRILGGEPLVHPDLSEILLELKKIDKIKHVQVVTNGTLLFDRKSLLVLKNKKFSVDISNYGTHSGKFKELVEQLEKHRVYYITQKEQKPWKSISRCTCRKRSERELKRVFALCREDCHSLLDGELHLCARSSHGTDLELIPKRLGEFIDVRNATSKRAMKRQLYELMNREWITACDYCDLFRLNEMDTVPSAEQISKREGERLMREWKEG